MALVSMVSTGAIFCSFVAGWTSGSSDCFLFPWVMADVFYGAGDRVVPFLVLKEKHSYDLCPFLPHLQQSSWLLLYSSHSLAGMPVRAASLLTHLSVQPY